MAVVRIFKVAELLGTTSQEVLQLLKQNHGIELKSASSTVAEIVARQFVERLAQQRSIELPKGDIFPEAPKAKRSKPAPVPPIPTGPPRPAPRLIRTVRPPTPSAPEDLSASPNPPNSGSQGPGGGTQPPKDVEPSPAAPTRPADFEVLFSPSFRPEDVRILLTALADYYRACGGVGLEIQFEFEDINVPEHSHA